jgi:hypothetical protein
MATFIELPESQDIINVENITWVEPNNTDDRDDKYVTINYKDGSHVSYLSDTVDGEYILFALRKMLWK